MCQAQMPARSLRTVEPEREPWLEAANLHRVSSEAGKHAEGGMPMASHQAMKRFAPRLYSSRVDGAHAAAIASMTSRWGGEDGMGMGVQVAEAIGGRQRRSKNQAQIKYIA